MRNKTRLAPVAALALTLSLGTLAVVATTDPGGAAGDRAAAGDRTPAEVPGPLGRSVEAAGEHDAVPIDPSAPVNPQTEATSGLIQPLGSIGSVKGLRSRAPLTKAPAPELGSPRDTGSTFTGPDRAVQTTAASVSVSSTPAPYEGMNLADNGAGWPPDTNGDVGPDHFIQAVNTSLAMYNKVDGTAAAGPMRFNTFFSSNGLSTTPCANSNDGDPVVMYDPIATRWIITDFAWSSSSGPWYECIAVSKTSDPVTGGWWLYGFQASSTSMNDYPKLGIWGNGIWMTANMFKGGRTYSNAQVWAMNRDDMINGRAIRFVTWNMGSSNFSLLPGNLDGTVSASDLSDTTTGPQYALSSWGTSSSLSMWKFDVTWQPVGTPSTGTVSSKISIPVTSYTKTSSRVSQKDSSETLDALGDRLMAPLQYRNGSLWAAHTAAPSTGAWGVRWWQIGNLSNATPSVLNQGTWAPDTTLARWMPSLAVNGKGEAAIVYSASASTAYPSIRMTGRVTGAASNEMNVAETVLHAGTGSQKGGYNRWGDYAVLAVDPADNCTFWYSTEYYTPVNGSTTNYYWKTKFGSFRLTTCP